ncbi:unnamed protein product [Adineta ricciae]|uniref:G-protein coupled receptors family 1 profile domain-containing protein n=1 Tax=Adineta ricciae TaxID=249248 RepID=A0A815VZY8_ADIRI|nr:unnamed protein product [Adineta ricciae]CAF1626680.1 unnamed protein product [Adineta ricciae]
MIIFGVLIIRNVRNVQNRIAPHGDNARMERLRSHDRQLVIMLLFQVLITILISVPYASLFMYYVTITLIPKYEPSVWEVAITYCWNIVATLLYATNPVIGFYIYTLTGPKFLAELKCCFRNGLHSMLTTLGLVRCLPLGIQQTLLGTAVISNSIAVMMQSRRKNNALPTQQ